MGILHLITNAERVKMSDNNSKKSKKSSKSQQDLGQKVTEEWNRFTKNIPDVKQEIEDVINSVGEEKDTMLKRAKEAMDSMLKRAKEAMDIMLKRAKEARDKMMEVFQESKKHSQVVLFGVIFGGLVVILAYGTMKMIC